ncbi:MAG: hypothetical protein HYY83_12180 [Deltaproteobacteria bacterium]|nr:hypothetical protein [Deltaproteobacteria bacterium]
MDKVQLLWTVTLTRKGADEESARNCVADSVRHREKIATPIWVGRFKKTSRKRVDEKATDYAIFSNGRQTEK